MSHPKLRQARDIIAAAEDETLPEPVRAVAIEAAKVMDRTGNVNGAHKMVEKAKQAHTPAAKALGALIDDTLTSTEPDWQITDAVDRYAAAVLKFLCLDPVAVANCRDAATVEKVGTVYDSIARWMTKFQAARPPQVGLRVIGGGK